MHYSAKRGIVIACRPSVCLSDVGGSGSHRLEILETNCTNNLGEIWEKRERGRILGLPKFLSTPYYLRNE